MQHNERQQTIERILTERGRVSVRALAAELFVSEMTVRRDLELLEKDGVVKRYHGGAVSQAPEQPVSVRYFLMNEEKKRLATKAAAYLENAQTVFLDSSSSVAYLVPHIAQKKDVRVITNSVRTLLLLQDWHIPAMLLGGDYYEKDMCTVGPITQNAARDINADVAFLSCKGIAEGKLSDSDGAQAAIRREIAAGAGKTICILDTSKFGKKYTFTVLRESDITALITEIE